LNQQIHQAGDARSKYLSLGVYLNLLYPAKNGNLLWDEPERESVRGRGIRILGVFPFLLSAHFPGDVT